MRTIIIILFWLTYMIVLGLTFVLFPRFNVNILICHIPLIGWAAWLFGRTGGLLVALSLLMAAAYMLSFLYAEIAEYFVAKASGSAIYIFVVFLVAFLRKNHDDIKAINARLDQCVAMRNQELRTLTWRLLNDSEQRRANKGRDIHDGIGQQLTGARLLASSLKDKLKKEGSPDFELAAVIASRIGTIHDVLRRVARVLFPVSISESGLTPALLELGAALKETRGVDTVVYDNTKNAPLADSTALQLFRIGQETIMHAVMCAKATWTRIVLETHDDQISLAITHDGDAPLANNDASYLGLIEYRLAQIVGRGEERRASGGATTHLFTLPIPRGDEMG